MGFIIRMTSIICKSAMLSIQILFLLPLAAVGASFIFPKQKTLLGCDSNCIKYRSQVQVIQTRTELSLVQGRHSTALRGSLRDILNDGPTAASDIVNSQIDTVEQRQKLTNQLKNFSTQEIKRELEQTYKISTAALRGKDQLITALVMARLTGSLSTPPANVGVDPNFRDQYKEPPRRESAANGFPSINNANYQKDMELMSDGEIKRELQLYGISIDRYADKMELLSILTRERRLRNIPTPSKRPKIEVNVVPTASPRENRNNSPGMSDEEGNESIRSPSRMAELTKVTILTKNQKEAKKQSQQQPSGKYEEEGFSYSSYGSPTAQDETPFYADEASPLTDSSYDGAKLRDLQIAFEFERVQAALSTPEEITYELASKFDIDTKYFMGVNEMAYALAVARVDAAIEREARRRSGKDDGCEVSDQVGGAPISKNRNANFDGMVSENFSNGQRTRPECIDEVNGELPSREELISMEFQRLQPLDEYELSWELEAQYGIPAKHFYGQKELAYALAVERVDTAQKEAEAANLHESQNDDMSSGSSQFAWMSEEDMMRMMEEEMMKESMPLDLSNAKNGNGKQSSTQSTTMQDLSPKNSKPTSLKDMIQNNPKKEPRSQQSANGSFQYQGETLRERERRENKAQQTSTKPKMGTVVGDGKWNNDPISTAKPNKTESPPLSEVLKGSPRQRSSARHKSRERTSTSPPRSSQQQRSPRSASKASSPFDVSFGVGAWKTGGGIGSTVSRTYQSYGANDNYEMHPRSPFEVPPFPDPEMYANYQPQPPPPFGSYVSENEFSDSTSFEPGKFTPPRKHNVEGMPPPPRRKNVNSRGFNIRDTEGPRPFIGVQTVMDQFMPPSPPLQVEPPPPDENNPPPKRPFEPAPFSRPQPHTVYNDRPPREPRGSQWKTAPPPPPKNKWNQTNKSRPSGSSPFDRNQTSKSRPGGYSPFDRVKDIFTNNNSKSSGSKGKDEDDQVKDKFEDQVKFKYDKVEVMNDEWSPFDGNGQRQKRQPKTKDVKFVDVELDAEGENQYSYKDFADAWKGGPKSDQSHEDSIPGIVNNSNVNNGEPPDAMKKAYELLANPQINSVATKVRSNPKVIAAVQSCMGAPSMFAFYLEDDEIGPTLQELKDCITGQ